jgi:serine protease Do
MVRAELRLPRRATVGAVLACLVILPVARAANNGYAELVRQVGPSVVTVLVEEKHEGAAQRAVDRATANTTDARASEIIRRLLSGPESRPPSQSDFAQGSGFVIRADGLIVTNRHVIAGARSVRIKLSSGQELAAKVIGADAATDIALLKVSSSGLPVLRLGSSTNVAVGDVVIAIGNPFGLGQSVTTGVLSARGRALVEDPYIDFLQTDAAINFGNSGGPLLSEDGVVIGVTSAILSPSGGSVGLGFAIPAETVAAVVGELETHGRVDRGFLGISAQPMTAAIGRALGVDSATGALVTSLEPHGPAVGALQVGDVLLSIGDEAVTFERLGRITGRLRPGSTVQAIVVRDGQRQTLALLIGQLPDPPEDPALTGDTDTWVPALELGIAKSTATIRRAIKAGDEPSGLIVTQLRQAGAGALAGLKVGDLITYAGSKHLQDVTDLAKVGKPSTRLPLLLLIVRDGGPRFVAITGQEDPDQREGRFP